MSYKVTIQPSGHEFELAENEMVLDGALRNGIMFPYGCRGGSCGTCFGKVLAGEINFPDGLPLGLMESDKAQGQALFCCAVAAATFFRKCWKNSGFGNILIDESKKT